MILKRTYSSCSWCRSSFCKCSFRHSCSFHLGAQDMIRFVIICHNGKLHQTKQTTKEEAKRQLYYSLLAQSQGSMVFGGWWLLVPFKIRRCLLASQGESVLWLTGNGAAAIYRLGKIRTGCKTGMSRCTLAISEWLQTRNKGLCTRWCVGWPPRSKMITCPASCYIRSHSRKTHLFEKITIIIKTKTDVRFKMSC